MKIEENHSEKEQTAELPEKKDQNVPKKKIQNGDFTEMKAMYVRETEKAVCVQFNGVEKENWVPKSILKNPLISSNEYQNILLPNWFIEKEIRKSN
jgi:hypothetical protein